MNFFKYKRNSIQTDIITFLLFSSRAPDQPFTLLHVVLYCICFVLIFDTICK